MYTLMLLPFGIRSTSRPSLDWHDQVRSMASSYWVYIGVYIGRVFRGVCGVYMVVYTCITGVHRCIYGYKWYIQGVYRVYKGGIL